MRGCALARQMADRLGAHETVTILNDVVLNQVLLRVRARDGRNVTPAVIAAVQDEGVCWVGGTSWEKEPAMRISISHWATSPDDIEASAKSILRAVNAEAR
jgi:hypothetical protein